MPKITPCLRFDANGEDAANFYVSVFKNSTVGAVSRYGEGPSLPAGTALTVAFTLDRTDFTALNGGSMFKFSEAISFQVDCADQAEVDYFWEKLTEGGGQTSQCGWLKDRFGLSWQIAPHVLPELMKEPNAGKIMGALLQMTKLDIAKLQEAARSQPAAM
jgi:predicted 3-demethylubiquinone-9 3-methyltransferase (glyoxalase superfamily)